MTDPVPPTAGEDYAKRLTSLQHKGWKQVLHVQAPWQLHIKSLKLGKVLDVGCGNGRNLVSLDRSSVGVDHNPFSIQAARESGVTAYTTDEFFADHALSAPDTYDSMLVAHVIEHLTPAEAEEVVGSYLPMIKSGGRLVWITPQERGFRSDATHVTFADFAGLAALASKLGVEPVKHYSFPFPRFVGKFFTYNEFVSIWRRPRA
jgi:2-polyprenyl-3-methyl-5-hydroxy-6-metoxy-1,4-benzoquinol methylase